MSGEDQFEAVKYWVNILRSVFEGKKIIVVGEVIAGILPRARMLKELGADSTFMLASEGLGTGEMPTAEDGEWKVLEIPKSENIVEAIHLAQRLLADLPRGIRQAIDKFDPAHEAIVVGSFMHELPEVAGRPSLAYRKPEWLALDDKTIIDALWDKIGIPRSDSTIVEVSKSKITEVIKQLDAGDGVVLSGDSREGVSGGGEGTRWVRSGSDLDSALAYYQKNCDKLRVMPFLEGIPCSIHGMVFPDYVAAFRPVEMIVLRNPDSNQFFYAGTGTYWDPRLEDREAMRSIAKKVGEALRQSVNYRGLFTVDGVLTREGFRPTELNPRAGAGIKPLLIGLGDLPLELLAQTLAAEVETDFKPRELEELILRSADQNRSGGTWKAIPKQLSEVDKRPIKYLKAIWEWAQDDVETTGWVSVGPGPLGGFIRLTLKEAAFTPGDSFAPLACSFWQFIDQEMNIGIGELEPAKLQR